jgi:hypothetical protein
MHSGEILKNSLMGMHAQIKIPRKVFIEKSPEKRALRKIPGK